MTLSFFFGRHEKKTQGVTLSFFIGRHEKNIREIIEMHTNILMSCVSSLLMIDYHALSTPLWCSGVHSAEAPWDRGSSLVDVLCWKTLISISCEL